MQDIRRCDNSSGCTMVVQDDLVFVRYAVQQAQTPRRLRRVRVWTSAEVVKEYSFVNTESKMNQG